MFGLPKPRVLPVFSWMNAPTEGAFAVTHHTLRIMIAATLSACSTMPSPDISGYQRAHPLTTSPKGGSPDVNQWISEVDTGFIPDARLSQTPAFVEEDLISKQKIHAKKSIPLEVNERVDKWIRYFTEQDRDRMQRFLDRGATYRSLISETLRAEGIPQELFYLALIESGFQNQARSHAGAVGVWQFIPATGRRYGLQVNQEVDERRDPVRATVAAARYLRDLHTVFQSWYLAMAAYNAGEMRILGAIMNSDTRDFWDLAERKALPKETMNYIPKFLAAAIIGHHPERFGFRQPTGDAWPILTTAAVPARIRLADLAKATGVSRTKLEQWNPALFRKRTPGRSGTYALNVTPEVAQILKNSSKQIAGITRYNSRIAKRKGTTHRVRRGENLYGIAKKYGLTVSKLKKFNRLTSSRIFAGQRLKVSDSGKLARSKSTPTRYRVRRGDTLSEIARRHKLSVSKLKSANRLSRSKIFVGQLLKLPRKG